ncbi:hematopoietic prostaglandin D synthase-like [Actinia tenebrosa]|uniref:Hematopoietic prostaglandin D synthase-like n=1 Tax=Actinia tenebrosa TaxID=6105 RepID=A0A6P8J6B4_ACTTE|nr:hematopoietic prostaglandin D synthase-like [Actinia tenebrosa]
MPVYKLHYFNVRGRAELSRLCFAAAGVDYEDLRHTPEEWQQMKKDNVTPLGQLPMMEVDDEKFSQSMTIFRYVARQTGLCPTDSLQIAKCDMIVDTENDLAAKRIKYYYEKDEKLKEIYKGEYFQTYLPEFVSKITGLLKKNNDGKGFFIGDKMTYADIAVFNVCDTYYSYITDYPELKAHHERVGKVPGIKAWLEKRPKTDL